MKKILLLIIKTIITIFFCFFILILYGIFIAPKNHEKKNLKDLENHISFFKEIIHPTGTTEIHFQAFFGNSSGTSNHCEHIIDQIRKYDSKNEFVIKKYYEDNYPEIAIEFIKTVDECCTKYDETEFRTICAGWYSSQPTYSYEEIKKILPVYNLQFFEEGKYLADSDCN
tara:strand:+ start:20 stop:529 length:510 start_codon:yes stop_codon:yes gene_type:complete